MMPGHADAMRQCLESHPIDIARIRRLWKHVAPHLPQEMTDDEAMASAHYARTAADTVALKFRAYSHAWLRDLGLPSALPDNLKPAAERAYPRIVSAVGVGFMRPDSAAAREGQKFVQRAMVEVIENVAADGKLEDTDYLLPRLLEARRRAKQLLG